MGQYNLIAMKVLAVAALVGVIVAVPAPAQPQAQAPAGLEHGRLFPPENLGLLEGPDRDIWQKPDQIMDALAVHALVASLNPQLEIGQLFALYDGISTDPGRTEETLTDR